MTLTMDSRHPAFVWFNLEVILYLQLNRLALARTAVSLIKRFEPDFPSSSKINFLCYS